jgi:hypothetical protein
MLTSAADSAGGFVFRDNFMTPVVAFLLAVAAAPIRAFTGREVTEFSVCRRKRSAVPPTSPSQLEVQVQVDRLFKLKVTGAHSKMHTGCLRKQSVITLIV